MSQPPIGADREAEQGLPRDRQPGDGGRDVPDLGEIDHQERQDQAVAGRRRTSWPSSTRRAAGGSGGGRSDGGTAGSQPGEREHGRSTVAARADKSRTLIGRSRSTVIRRLPLGLAWTPCTPLLNVHPEVAAALAAGPPGGGPRVHDHQPRAAAARQPARSRCAIEEAVRRAGAVPATIAVVDGRVVRGPRRGPRWTRSPMRDDVVKVALRDVGDARRARRHRRDHRRQHQPRGGARRHPRVRHGRPRRRPPRGARHLGRVRRPHDARRHRRSPSSAPA